MLEYFILSIFWSSGYRLIFFLGRYLVVILFVVLEFGFYLSFIICLCIIYCNIWEESLLFIVGGVSFIKGKGGLYEFFLFFCVGYVRYGVEGLDWYLWSGRILVGWDLFRNLWGWGGRWK